MKFNEDPNLYNKSTKNEDKNKLVELLKQQSDEASLDDKKIDYNDEFEDEEKSFILLDSYESEEGQEEAWQYWQSLTQSEQQEFFSNKNTVEKFKTFSDTQKVHIITFAMRSLHNTPSQILDVIKDERVIKHFLKNFYRSKNGWSIMSNDIKLLTIGAYENFGPNPKISDLEYEDRGFWLKADRFNKSKDLLVSGYEENEASKIKKDYKELVKGFSYAFDLACRIDSMEINDTVLSTRGIWDNEFKKLSEDQKADVLGRALCSCHGALVFAEVWNSGFSPDSVEKENSRNKRMSRGYHNEAHSIIYGTYQPNSIYEARKGSFDREMSSTAEVGGGVDEYPFHKMIISILENTESLEGKHDRLVDMITEFWVKNRNPIFGPYVAGSLSHLDPNRAASNLLKSIESEKGEKNHISSILYRIEFGKIGISNEGVKYLEMMYDLGEYNNESFYVERLTPKGEVGIFNSEKELIKYFELGDLTTKEKKIKAEVFDFIYDTLFYSKEGETKEDYQKRIQYLEEFKLKYSDLVNNDIFSETGVRLNNLNFKEQGSFLQFMSGVENKDKLTDFLKVYRENGVKTFVSIQQEDQNLVNKILNIGEKLPEDLAKIIFGKYGDIINTVDNTEYEIRSIFGNREIPQRIISSVKGVLLKRGSKMLSDLGSRILSPDFIVNEQEILRDLDEIKEETIILGKSYESFYKEGIEVPIEDVTTIRETKTTDLTQERKNELMKIYEKGRPKVTYENKEHLEFLKEEFKNELNDKDFSVFEICFKDETIIISLINDKKDKDTLYIGGLTFVEDVKNAVIAEASMNHVVKKFNDKNIKALVDSRNPLRNMYFKRFGFKIIKKLDSPEEIANNGGEIYYEIERARDQNTEERIGEKESIAA